MVMRAMPDLRRHLSAKLCAFHVKKPTWRSALNSSNAPSTRRYTGVFSEFLMLEEIAAMAGVCLTAPRGAPEFTNLRFVRQCDPVGLGSAAGVRLSPDLSRRSGERRQILVSS